MNHAAQRALSCTAKSWTFQFGWFRSQKNVLPLRNPAMGACHIIHSPFRKCFSKARARSTFPSGNARWTGGRDVRRYKIDQAGGRAIADCWCKAGQGVSFAVEAEQRVMSARPSRMGSQESGKTQKGGRCSLRRGRRRQYAFAYSQCRLGQAPPVFRGEAQNACAPISEQ